MSICSSVFYHYLGIFGKVPDHWVDDRAGELWHTSISAMAHPWQIQGAAGPVSGSSDDRRASASRGRWVSMTSRTTSVSTPKYWWTRMLRKPRIWGQTILRVRLDHLDREIVRRLPDNL